MAAAAGVGVAFRYVVLAAIVVLVAGIPTTLDGPFAPATVAFNPSLRQGSSDLPPTDPRIVKSVLGNQPEQISLALSTPDAIWVTWITGMKSPPTQISSKSFLSRLILLHVCFVAIYLVAENLRISSSLCVHRSCKSAEMAQELVLSYASWSRNLLVVGARISW